MNSFSDTLYAECNACDNCRGTRRATEVDTHTGRRNSFTPGEAIYSGSEVRYFNPRVHSRLQSGANQDCAGIAIRRCGQILWNFSVYVHPEFILATLAGISTGFDHNVACNRDERNEIKDCTFDLNREQISL